MTTKNLRLVLFVMSEYLASVLLTTVYYSSKLYPVLYPNFKKNIYSVISPRFYLTILRQ